MNLPAFIGLRYTGAKRTSRSVSFLAGVSMSGLAVGVALLILVLSVMNGFDRELRQRILGLVPQAGIYHRQGVEDWKTLQTRIVQHDEVEAVAPFVQLDGLVSHKGESMFVALYGFDPEAERSVSLINDYVLPEVQQRISSGEAIILLGKSVAKKMGVSVLDKIMVVVPDKNRSTRSPKIAYFTVGQIIESKTELDASLALTSLSQASKLSGSEGRITGLRLKLTDLFAAPRVVYEVTQQLGSGYYSSNWTRTHWNLYQAIQMSKNLVGLLMSLIVAIAAFNVVSTLVLVVIDKQSDIAILRTLGISGRGIMGIFVVMGSTIGLIGTMLGIGVGCLLSLMAQDFVAFIESVFHFQFLQSDVYPLTYLPTEIRVTDIVSVTATALGMSLVATLFPAWKASRVQPAVALRYE
ncbi:MAG: lipoprotein-releasing ABC transporter permease subunit [Agarilytica sp.]